MRDPLDLGNLLVLQRDESGAVVQDDVAEVLEPNLLAPELREVIAGSLDLRTHGTLPHASAGAVGMERCFHAFDRREPSDLNYDWIGDEEVTVRVCVDHLAVLRIQRLGGHLDVVQAQAEGEHELPEGRGSNPPAAQRLQRPRPRVVDPGEAALRDLLPVSRLRQLEILETQDPEVDEPRTPVDLEDVPDPGLHQVLHHAALAAEDVPDPEAGVVAGPRRVEQRPDAALLDLVERLREERLGLRPDRIVEDEEQLPMVALRVCVVQDERPRVADVERAARIGREAQDHRSVDGVRERWQLLWADIMSDLLEEFRCNRRELRPLRFEAEIVHVRDDAFDVRRRLFSAPPEGGVFGEQPAEDRLRVRLAFVEDGVLQREFPCGFEGHVGANFLGLLSLLEGKPKRFLAVVDRRSDSLTSNDPSPFASSIAASRKSISRHRDVTEVSILIPTYSEKRRSGNHFACVFTSRTVGRGRGRLSLRTRVGLASAGWAVAFSLLAVVSATPRGPTAMLSVADTTPMIGPIVYFDASASVSHDNGNGRIASYEFDFGDGNRTREQASPLASHSYSLSGPRRASVTVEDARGNEGTASVRIEVQPKPSTGGIPDLTPASASTIPTEPIDGQIAILSITIANHGNGTADAAMIDVMDQRPNGTILAIGNASLPTQLAPEDSVVVYSPTFVAAAARGHPLQPTIRSVSPPETDVADTASPIPMTVLPAMGPPPPPIGGGVETAIIAGGLAAAAVAALLDDRRFDAS